MALEEEKTLAKVRLHWGIFIPAILVASVVAFLMGLVLFGVHAVMALFNQALAPLNRGAVTPQFGSLWILSLLPLGLMVAGLFVLTWITYAKSEIALTNRRLVFRTGLLSKRAGELPLENVESILISEPLLGRVFGYGTVIVTTVGGSTIPLSFLGSPGFFHSTLQKAVLDAKNCIRGVPNVKEGAVLGRTDDSRYMPKG